jgi:hypothetical protein
MSAAGIVRATLARGPASHGAAPPVSRGGRSHERRIDGDAADDGSTVDPFDANGAVGTPPEDSTHGAHQIVEPRSTASAPTIRSSGTNHGDNGDNR